MQDKQARSFYNAMELLVAEEVNKQLETYPASLREYINPVEVATFALNRLPSLYASCEEGLRRQQNRGKIRYRTQVSEAVRQGLAAVLRDPIRRSTPLEEEDILKDVKASVSKELRQPLEDEIFVDSEGEMSLERVVRYLEQVLNQDTTKDVAQKKLTKLLSQLNNSWGDSRYQR